MDDSVASTIEQIKRQEHSKEAKLKAKREYDSNKKSLERQGREVIAQVKKLKQERNEMVIKISELRSQQIVHKIRLHALSEQLKVTNGEFENLINTKEKVIQELNKNRLAYLKTVQEVSDECDVWALLMKPATTEIPLQPHVKKYSERNPVIEPQVQEARLRHAIERREIAVAERKRLMEEPDSGEEFLRIKNALRYSLEKTSNLNLNLRK